MKISVKMALFATLILVIAMTICCVFVLSFAKSNTTETILNTGLNDYAAFYRALINNNIASETEQTEAFRYSYAKQSFQSCSGSFEYALKKGGDYISNNTGINPAVLFSEYKWTKADNNESRRYIFATANNTECFMVSEDITLLGEPYTLFLVRDVSEAMRGVDGLMTKCIAACAAVVGVSAVTMVFMIWRSLRPLKALSMGAERFARGAYDSRIHISMKNELGDLANSFNSMADAIERHITDIEATSEERRMLLSALSHEMKTPVTAITGYAHALTHAKLTEEQKQEAIHFIDSECRRLERLSGKLMQLISLNGAELQLNDVSARELERELKAILQPIAKEYGVSLHVLSDKKSIHIERDLIVSLFTNLFDNARKAGAKHIQVSVLDGCLRVSDDGKGIPASEIPKITQPFYVLDKSRNTEGFGLGLALVRRIAELHGTDLVIDSEENIGTIMEIQL